MTHPISILAALVVTLLTFDAARAEALGAFGVQELLGVKIPAHPVLSPDGSMVAAVVDRTDGVARRRLLWVAPADALHQGRMGLELDLAAGAPAWSPDGRALAVTVRRNDRPQVALIEVRRPTVVRRWLTQLPTGAREPSFSPDARWVVFESRVFPECGTQACQAKALAEDEKRRARIYDDDAPRRWTRWRDGRARYLWRVPVGGGPPSPISSAPAPPIAEPRGPEPRWTFVDDDHLVYVGEPPAQSGTRAIDSDLYLISLEGQLGRLTESPGRDHAPRSGRGRILHLASPSPTDGPEVTRARWLNLRTGRSRPLLHALEGPVREAVPFGPGALLVLDHRGHRPLVFAPLGGGTPVTRIAEGTVSFVHAAASRITAVVSRFGTPPEIVVLGPDGRELARSRINPNPRQPRTSGASPRLTTGTARPRRPRIHSREVRVSQTDGTQVPGFVLRPPGPLRRRPTLVLVHGGPESAWTDGWHPRWNAAVFTGAGFTVLLPNLAGSVGYGIEHTERVRGSWGGAPYADLLAFVEAAAAWPEVGRPVALAGASFGGYLVGWSLAQSDRFACGVSHAGVFDPAALWGETDARWFPEWEFGGPPWAPSAMYDKWSPARYAHRIRAPMLLTHGGRDFRVPVEQSLRLFSTLRRRGLPVRFLHLPEEGHLVRDPQALRTWYDATLGFLRGCLGGEPTAAAASSRKTETRAVVPSGPAKGRR